MAARDEGDIELGPYFKVLLRNWWVIVALIVIGIVAASVFTLATKKTYAATSSVYIGQVTDANGNPMPGLSSNAKAAVELVQSDAVLKAAATQVGKGETAAHIRNGLALDTPTSAVKGATTVVNFVNITVTDTKPQRAADAANALAAMLLQRLSPTTDAKIAALQQQIAAQSAELAAAGKRSAQAVAALRAIALGGGSATEKALASAPYIGIVQSAATEREPLLIANRDNQLMLLVAQNVEKPSLLHEAAVPETASGPNMKLNLAAGLVAGLVVGIVLAFVRGRRSAPAA
jgi:capsular polysaccharide biosynthesis protein